MRPALIVCDSGAVAGRAAADLRREGWLPVAAAALPAEPWDLSTRRLLVTGGVEDPDERAVLLLAAARGVAVVASGPAGSPELATFYDELARLGSVAFAAGAARPAALTAEQRGLLERLAAGETLGEAARALSLSRRTADRRLAEARRALGVRSTAEAVLALRAGEETRRGPGLARS